MALRSTTVGTFYACVYSCAGTSQNFMALDAPLKAKSTADSTLAVAFDNGTVFIILLM